MGKVVVCGGVVERRDCVEVLATCLVSQFDGRHLRAVRAMPGGYGLPNDWSGHTHSSFAALGIPILEKQGDAQSRNLLRDADVTGRAALREIDAARKATENDLG